MRSRFFAEHAGEAFAEHEPRAGEADLDVVLSELKDFGRFLDREFLEVAQHENDRILRIEFVEHVGQFLTRFAIGGDLLGRATPLDDVFGPRQAVFVVARRLGQGDRRMRRPTAQQGEGVVGGDAQQPSGELRLAAKALKMLKNAQKSLLNDFLGVLPLVDDPPGQTVDPAFVLADQGIEGGIVARLGLFDKFLVRIGAHNAW